MSQSVSPRVDDATRRRLRDAQRVEAEAVKAVELATARHDRAVATLHAAISKHQVAVDDAASAVARAQAALVAVSGLERAATLLDVPAAKLRAVAKAASPPKPELDGAQACDGIGVGVSAGRGGSRLVGQANAINEEKSVAITAPTAPPTIT